MSQNLYKAVYTDDIFITSDRPVFVYWNGSTKNTPFKAGLTDCQEGFAFSYGAWADYMTVVCFVKNDSRMWVWSKSRNEWVEYASKDDLVDIGKPNKLCSFSATGNASVSLSAYKMLFIAGIYNGQILVSQMIPVSLFGDNGAFLLYKDSTSTTQYRAKVYLRSMTIQCDTFDGFSSVDIYGIS